MKSTQYASFPLPSTAIAFRPEYLDFRRGIHVGNLEENERITRILKLALEARYQQAFVTERWRRARLLEWIALLPRADREASRFLPMSALAARSFSSRWIRSRRCSSADCRSSAAT